jgi:hypothetical protein
MQDCTIGVCNSNPSPPNNRRQERNDMLLPRAEIDGDNDTRLRRPWDWDCSYE